MMESDHKAAGEILAELRMVTVNYTLPANAIALGCCTMN